MKNVSCYALGMKIHETTQDRVKSWRADEIAAGARSKSVWLSKQALADLASMRIKYASDREAIEAALAIAAKRVK